jgi:hypothetical protein
MANNAFAAKRKQPRSLKSNVMPKGDKPMNGNPVEARPALSRKSLSDFQKALEDRYLFHKEKAERQVTTFKPIGFIFGLAIPIIAAVVTFSMTTESGISKPVAALMGLGLTLLTIVNSVLKPDERFAKAAQHCIALEEWKREFDINMAESHTTDEMAFHAMIREMDKALSEIGKSMAENFVPKPPA